MLQEVRSGAFTYPPAAVPVGLLAPQEPSLKAAFSELGKVVHFDRNKEIYGEGENAVYFYQVIDGAVRTYKLLDDGRRQIGAFHRAGDIFGLEGGGEYAFTAESVSRCSLRLVKRSALLAVAARHSAIASDLWALTANSLRDVQEHLLLLGRKTAEERVASFLLGQLEPGSRTVELAMSRQDIADYLGLTIETVSRTFTHLESTAAIELPTSRRVVLRNRASVHRLDA